MSVDLVQFVDSIGDIYPTITDTFGRTVSGGWGSADTGQAWTVEGTASDYSVDGSRGLHSLGSVNVFRHTVMATTAVDSQHLWSVTCPVLATGQAIIGMRTVRRVDANNTYRVEVSFDQAGMVGLRLRKVVGGSGSSLTFTNLLTYTAGTKVWVRQQVIGSTLRARYWIDGTPEPNGWTWTAIDTDLTSGGTGFSSVLNSGNTNTPPVVLAYDDLTMSSPASVRLDLNDDITWGLTYDRTDFSPPPLKESYAGSLLTDGELQTAAAYENRRLRLGLELIAATPDAVAAELAKLWRELNRDGNFLKWQPQGMSKPQFFRTIRSSETSVTDYPGAGTLRTVDVVVSAEPFAHGLRESLPSASVSNDPAATNGCFFDVSGVKGDVPAPLVLTRNTTNLGTETLLAVRHGGNPSGVPLLLQAEAMTSGTDTTSQPNDVAFSGSGNNFRRTTFATTPGYAARMSITAWPAVASTDARGQYRVFARLRRNGTTSTIKVRLRWAGLDFAEQTVTGSAVQMVDLTGAELVQIPTGQDPVFDGPSGVELPARGPAVELWASRSGAGTDTLDVDYLLFVPADDRLAIVHWPVSGAGRVVADGVNGMAYASAGDVTSGSSISYQVGGLPVVSPGVVNRVFVVNEVGVGLAEPAFPASATWDGYYWPRYLMVRGAS